MRWIVIPREREGGLVAIPCVSVGIRRAWEPGLPSWKDPRGLPGLRNSLTPTTMAETGNLAPGGQKPRGAGKLAPLRAFRTFRALRGPDAYPAACPTPTPVQKTLIRPPSFVIHPTSSIVGPSSTPSHTGAQIPGPAKPATLT
jgi:hypothetical protein